MLLVEILERAEVAWCVIGGLAVNHWAEEPIATADVDLVITTDKLEQVVRALEEAGFQSERFEWSVNLKRQSGVSVQISTAAFYQSFPSRSVAADVHGILLRVASLEDTLQGKLLAWRDTQRRPSKRQKDLLDITRMVEAHPRLQALLPADVARRLEQQ